MPGVFFPFILVLMAFFAGPPSQEGKAGQEPVTHTLSGTVLLLSDVVRTAGISADSDPIAKQVVVQSKSGEITPLLSDEASRALFVDERLRNRQTEVKYRKVAGFPYIQVVSFKIEENGALRTPEYYCEICTISVRFPQICPCCQGEMVLRMKPEPR